MRSIELSGKPRELGLAHGAAYKLDVQKCYEFYCQKIAKRSIDDLDRSVLRYLERKCAHLLEEMAGIAEGAGLTFDEILVYNHFNAMAGCTPAYFAETEVGPILGNNLDCGEEERDAMLVRIVRPDQGYPFITTTFVGTVWSTNGLNGAGFCHGNVFTRHDGMAETDGTATGIIKRDMVQRAGSVAEALEIARSHRHIGKIGIWLLADATGEALKLEQTNDEAFTFPVRDGFLFSTGRYESPIAEATSPEKRAVGLARAQTIETLREQGEIDLSVEGMQRLLSHHCKPGSVCRHEPYETNKDTTQSARILIPKQRRYLVTDGPPCRSPFLEFAL